MYDISYSIHVTSYPLYLWHHIHYVWQHNTVCCWYHTRHMCDIICTTDDITSTLSHRTMVFMMSQPLQVWYHTHCIRHHTLCIFVITTSLCHHIPTLLWHHTHSICNIICTALIIAHLQHVWYQTHYMHDIIWILCDITNNLYDIARLYSLHHFHGFHDITPTVYDMIYTLLVTSQPL